MILDDFKVVMFFLAQSDDSSALSGPFMLHVWEEPCLPIKDVVS